MFNGATEISAQDILTVSTVQLMAYGTIGVTSDRRIFRYGSANTAAAIPAGYLAVAEAVQANHTNIALALDAAAQATSVSVTLGATAVTANQYAEGLLTINAGTGAGYEARIKGHGAAAASGTLLLYLEVPLPTALTAASSKACLSKNPWKDVILSTTVSKMIGSPDVAIPALSFGWFQTQGLSSVLAGGAIAKGLTVSQGTTTAGSVIATAGATSPVAGITPEAAVSGEFRNIDLSLE